MNRYELAMTALDEIKRLAAEARANRPEITDVLLNQNGAIFYKNKSFSTEERWDIDEETCKFMIFYKSWPRFCFVCVYATKSGRIITEVFDNSADGPTERKETTFSPAAIHYLNVAMYYAADDSGKFDRPLSELNWPAAEAVLGQYKAKTE